MCPYCRRVTAHQDYLVLFLVLVIVLSNRSRTRTNGLPHPVRAEDGATTLAGPFERIRHFDHLRDAVTPATQCRMHGGRDRGEDFLRGQGGSSLRSVDGR